MLTNEQYVQSKGMVCPACEKNEASLGTDYDGDGDSLFVNAFCVSCGAQWTEEYSLVGYDYLHDKDGNPLA